ncbi:hypothetical protein VOLCADRAFT_107867 [Volvox carteri f. nagariensis]|uniref:Pre-mRNA polyadenylation factor Fip1 domain-containing protein n=1 Tax=Volvox carteri f. nagariensis TaxID=3068 RepID=D8UGY3_VOLCA|nr:uncharacterized protein VOLCADRAFT_107867 [Volvox carteri f. nagariensis]EFJ41031.1 hypothetical protein VOLCADRAFT_107867 [Volvox carteri f. nagariensis]|eukprot:XP_002957895.1 hypothetical protein VOLCADRAFT_107867 [Volvox carteri f. nagariensis]
MALRGNVPGLTVSDAKSLLFKIKTASEGAVEDQGHRDAETGEFKTNWSELGGVDPYACCISGGIRGWFIGAKTGNIENIINHVKTRQHMMACKQETQRLTQHGGLVARPMPPPGVRDVSCAWPPGMRMHLYGMSDEAAEEEYQRLYSQFQHRRTRRREQQPNALDSGRRVSPRTSPSPAPGARTVGPNMDPEAQRIVSPDVATWMSAIASLVGESIWFEAEGIDKIVDPSSVRVVTGGGVSSEGVQRDLLPIIEGSVVPTKHGNMSTEHVLFICSGAFHTAKPSDMLAEELQGRLPIRVELKGLTAEDFYRILTEPQNNMLRQQQTLPRSRTCIASILVVQADALECCAPGLVQQRPLTVASATKEQQFRHCWLPSRAIRSGAAAVFKAGAVRLKASAIPISCKGVSTHLTPRKFKLRHITAAWLTMPFGRDSSSAAVCAASDIGGSASGERIPDECQEQNGDVSSERLPAADGSREQPEEGGDLSRIRRCRGTRGEHGTTAAAHAAMPSDEEVAAMLDADAVEDLDALAEEEAAEAALMAGSGPQEAAWEGRSQTTTWRREALPQASTLSLSKRGGLRRIVIVVGPAANGLNSEDNKDAEEDAEVYLQLFGAAPAIHLPPRFAAIKPGPGGGAGAGGRGGLVVRLEAGVAGAAAAAGGGGGQPEGGAAGPTPSAGAAATAVAQQQQQAEAPAPDEDDNFEVTLEELDTAAMAAQQQQQAGGGGGGGGAGGGGATAGTAAGASRQGSGGGPLLPGLGLGGPAGSAHAAASALLDALGAPLAGADSGDAGTKAGMTLPWPPGGGGGGPGASGLNFRYNIEEAAWPTEARPDQAIKLPKQTRVTPEIEEQQRPLEGCPAGVSPGWLGPSLGGFGDVPNPFLEYRAFLSLGHGEIYELDLDRIIPHEASWRNPSANPADYFNYDMNETSWRQYCARVRTFRDTFTLRNKITALDPVAIAAAAAAAAASASAANTAVGGVGVGIGGSRGVSEYIDPFLPPEVISALRNLAARTRKSQPALRFHFCPHWRCCCSSPRFSSCIYLCTPRWEEDGNNAADGGGVLSDGGGGLPDGDADGALGESGWDGNEGGYGLAPGKGGRELHRRRTAPRLDPDVIITLVQANDLAAAAAAEAEEGGGDGAEAAAAGEQPQVKAEVKVEVKSEAEAEAVQDDNNKDGGGAVPADSGKGTIADTTGEGGGDGTRKEAAGGAAAGQRRPRALHPPVNADYDSAAPAHHAAELEAQHMPGPPLKRSRSPPVDARSHGRWPGGVSGPQVWEGAEEVGGGGMGRWERDMRGDRGRHDRDRRPGPGDMLPPVLPHGQQQQLMPPIGRMSGPPLPGMGPGGGPHMPPIDLMGPMGHHHLDIDGDFYLDGGSGGDGDGDDEDGGGGAAAAVSEGRRSIDAGGDSGGGTGDDMMSGMNGRGGGGPPPPLPGIMKDEPALAMPPIGPGVQMPGPVADAGGGGGGGGSFGAFGAGSRGRGEPGGGAAPHLGEPQDTVTEPAVERKGWGTTTTDEATAFGDFGSVGDYYMDDGYGNEDDDEEEDNIAAARDQQQQQQQVRPGGDHQPAAPGQFGLGDITATNSYDNNDNDAAEMPRGASHPDSLEHHDDRGRGAVHEYDGAVKQETVGSSGNIAQSAAAASGATPGPAATRGGTQDDDYGGGSGAGGDTFFSDSGAGPGAGGGLSVMDLLNPMAAIAGMGPMGALGPMGPMGALGPMHGLGMPGLMPGAMPPLVPGGVMPMGMGMGMVSGTAPAAAPALEGRGSGAGAGSSHRGAREGGRSDRYGCREEWPRCASA